jgi:NADPH-dependent 2,4-dienoyl-CoA reductase/sulfur reductase-like enzyme
MPVANRKVVVAGSGPLLLAVASTLVREGAAVVLIAEQAPWSRVLSFAAYLLRSHLKKFREGITLRRALKGIPYSTGCWLRGIHGQNCVGSVTITDGTRQWKEECDYVACGFGLVSNLELPLLIGCDVENQRVVVDSFQHTSIQNVYCAGEATGIGGVETALCEGQIAGLAMSEKQGVAEELFSQRSKQRRFAARLQSTFSLRGELQRLAEPATIVCRCEDVPLERLLQYRSWREAKLQSRCGMGACQGRICGPVCEFLFNWHTDSVRPPIFPCRVDQLLGSDD